MDDIKSRLKSVRDAFESFRGSAVTCTAALALLGLAVLGVPGLLAGLAFVPCVVAAFALACRLGYGGGLESIQVYIMSTFAGICMCCPRPWGMAMFLVVAAIHVASAVTTAVKSRRNGRR